jgi:hypothetical protein
LDSRARELRGYLDESALVTENGVNRERKLSPSMSLTQFDHGYWYAAELKRFADELGIPSAARLRKDELERAIKQFLRSGTITPSRKPNAGARSQPARRDVDIGLRLDRRVVRYTNDVATKEFLEREAAKLAPTFRPRSGAKYRLNRWREDQLRNGAELTYRDVVAQYVRLTQSAERFARIPHGRYINFMSDFLAGRPGATKAEAIKAWQSLKKMDCPKTYRDWNAIRSRKA